MGPMNTNMTLGIGVTSIVTSTSNGNYEVITGTEKLVFTSQSTSSTAFIVTQGVLYGILLTFGMLLNCCVIWVIRHKRSLQTVTNMWVTSLCISQVLICTTSLPIIILSVFSDDWLLGSVFCRIFGCYTTCFRTVSILSVAGIALDRYHVVTRPFSLRIRKSSARILIILTWWYGLSASIPPLFGIGLYRYSPNSHMCGVSWSLGGSALIFTAFYITSVYIVSILITAFSYKYIYQVTKAQANKRKRPSNAGGLGSNIKSSRPKYRNSYDYATCSDDEIHVNGYAVRNKKSSPAKRRLNTVLNGKLSRSGGSLRNRLSSTLSVGYSHTNIDNRAALTIGLVFIAFFATWIPYFAFGLYSAISGPSLQPNTAISWVEFFATWLSFSSAIWDPLLYGILNHNFRSHLRELYCCVKVNDVFGKSKKNSEISGNIYDDTHRHRAATVASNWREIIKNEEKIDQENAAYGRGGVMLAEDSNEQTSESVHTMTSVDCDVIISSPKEDAKAPERRSVTPEIIFTNSNHESTMMSSRDATGNDFDDKQDHTYISSQNSDVTTTQNMTSSRTSSTTFTHDINSKLPLPMDFRRHGRISPGSNLNSFRLNERMSSSRRFRTKTQNGERDPDIFFTKIVPEKGKIKSISQDQLLSPHQSTHKLKLTTFSSQSSAALSGSKPTQNRRLSNESGKIRRQKVRAPPGDKFHKSRNDKRTKLYQSATAL